MLVNISFRTINCSREIEQNVMQKRNKCKIFNHRNFTNRVGIVRLIFSNQMLETTNGWLTGYRYF